MRAISGNKWGASKRTLLLVYRSLIRSVIEYGSIAYDSAGEVNKRKLDSIQAQALRIVCGAVRGTATAALQVDVGEPPLQIRRLQHQVKYAAKVFCDINHPARAVFEPHWTDRSRNYTANTVPISNKIAEFFRENNTLIWDRFIWPLQPPWRRKEFPIDIHLSKIGNKNENPIALSCIAKDYIDSHSNQLHIYTDASKTTDITSAAFFIPELKVTSAVLLPSDLNIFSAELIAIKLSIEWILNSFREYNIIKHIVIFSDSLSSLSAIKAGSSQSRPNIINEIFELVDKLDVIVKLVWIPSHLGIPGNETVDKAARFARENCAPTLNYPLALNEVYSKIQRYVLRKWQNVWQLSDTGKFYREIEPSVSLGIKYENTTRRKETVITRLRFGVCRTNEYLHKIKVLSTDRCHECKTDVETVRHLLLDCPVSPLCGKVLDICTSLNMSPDLKVILQNRKILDAIYSNIKRAI